MARSVEATGRNVAEATANALRELGVPEGQADVTVLSRGRPGLFGIIRRLPAKVRVVHKVSMRDGTESLVAELLRLMRFSSQLEVREQKQGLYINIETAGTDALLIGNGGVTLSSLEYIVNRLLQQDDRRGYHVTLDVGGYKRRQGLDTRPPAGDEAPRRRSGRRRRGRQRGPDRAGEPRAQAPTGEQASRGQQRRGGRRRSGRGRRRRPGGGPSGEPRPGAEPQETS